MEASDEAYRATLRLRAVRTYRPEQITDEHLAAILEAARWTGSSKNTQPWQFVAVQDPEQRASVAAAGRFAGPLESAPTVLVMVSTPDGGDFDMGRAAQNVMLAASGLGIASCPVTLHDEDRARAALGVPADHGCRWAIALGYPDPDAAGDSSPYGGRKPIADLVRYERI
jgi:nitroreductase